MKFIYPIQKMLFFATPLVMLASCSKDDTNSNTNNSTNTDGTTLSAYMQSHAPSNQSFTGNGSGIDTFYTTNNTMIIVPAGSFKKQNGTQVTGDYTLLVKELTKASEMLFANKPTPTNDGQLLTSYGEYLVGAVQGSDTLSLVDSASIALVIKPQRENIPLWNGDSAISVTQNGYNYQNTATSVTNTFYVNPGVTWTNANQTTQTTTLGQGFQITSLFNWINCDVLSSENSGTKTTILGYFGDKYNENTGQNYNGQEPSMLFFKPDNAVTVVRLYDLILNSASQYNGFISYQNSMPIGMEGTLIAISYKDNKFYAQSQHITIANTTSNYMALQLNLTEVSETQLTQLIENLD